MMPRVCSIGFSVLALIAVVQADVPDARKPRGDAQGDPLPPAAIARIGSLRLVHGNDLIDLTYSPDGKTVYSAGWDGQVRAWDASNGRELHMNLPPAQTLALAPKGRSVVLIDDKALQLFDLASQKRLWSVPLKWSGGALGKLPVLAISADEKWVVRAMESEAVVHIHEIATGKVTRVCKMPGHANKTPPGNPVRQVVTSADGKWLAGMTDVGVFLWDLNTGILHRHYSDLHKGFQADLSADGKWLYALVRESASLRCWSTNSLEERFDVPVENQGPTIRCSPDGTRVVTATATGGLSVWDARTGKAVANLASSSTKGLTTIAFSPNGKEIATGDTNGCLELWDLATGKLVTKPSPQLHILATEFSSDCREILAVQPNGLWRFSALTGKALKPVVWNENATTAMFSRDGAFVAVGFDDRELTVLDTTTGKDRFKPRIKTMERAYCLDPLGKYLAVAESTANKLHLMNARTGQLRRTLQLHPKVTGYEIHVAPNGGVLRGGVVDGFRVLFSHDGRTLWVHGKGNQTQRWEVLTGKERDSVTLGSPDATKLVLSPANDLLALAGAYHSVLVDGHTGESLHRLESRTSSPRAVSFSPDGKLLACVDSDVTLWNTTTGKLLTALEGHRSTVWDARFSRDGKRLLSYANDGTLLVWDVQEALRLTATRIAVRNPRSPDVLWTELASDDAILAERAGREMVQNAAASLPLLRKHLRPVPPVEDKLLRRLLDDLDHDTRERRDQAEQHLATLGEQVADALEKAAASGSAEVKRRATRLLARLDPIVEQGADAREIRAVEVLEQMQSPLARRLLRELAGGAPNARLTKEAAAALLRVSRRFHEEP